MEPNIFSNVIPAVAFIATMVGLIAAIAAVVIAIRR